MKLDETADAAAGGRLITKAIAMADLKSSVYGVIVHITEKPENR